jgi:hypothetical protein
MQSGSTRRGRASQLLPGHLSGSRFDYEWDHLQDALFQDKDCEGFVYIRVPVYGDVAGQWGEFGNIAARDRGFAAKPAPVRRVPRTQGANLPSVLVYRGWGLVGSQSCHAGCRRHSSESIRCN